MNEGCSDEEESLVEENVLEVGEDESLLDHVLVAIVATDGETEPATEAAGKENRTPAGVHNASSSIVGGSLHKQMCNS